MNAECPACVEHIRHTPEDWQAHHPYATHGYVVEMGWTHPQLELAARVNGTKNG